jgi:ATP-dependent Clp protease protease subunit
MVFVITLYYSICLIFVVGLLSTSVFWESCNAFVRTSNYWCRFQYERKSSSFAATTKDTSWTATALLAAAGGQQGSGNRMMVRKKSNTLVMMPSSTPMVPWQPPGQEYAQFIDLNSRLYRERIMLLGKFIDEEYANQIISILLYLRKEDPEKKISLYINCPGALLRPAMAVYDTIKQCRDQCEISTLNLGMSFGMGALLCAAGTKGMRSSMPNARFLLQRIGLEKPFQGQASDIALEVKNVKECNDRLAYELAKMTGQPISRIQQDLQRDFYLSSDEAVTYGLIDNVLLPPSSKGISRIEYTRDPWTGAKIMVNTEREVNLGVFGGPDEQRYQTSGTPDSEEGGLGQGWRRGYDDRNNNYGDDGNDNYEPPTQK